MSSRADMYRQRADDAKNRAAQAKNLSIKSAFEEVAACWLVLAEQVEWIDRKEASPPSRHSGRKRIVLLRSLASIMPLSPPPDRLACGGGCVEPPRGPPRGVHPAPA